MTDVMEPQPAPPTPPTHYLVRHGAMRHLGEFDAVPGHSFGRCQPAIVRTERGLEVAEVLCPSTPQAFGLIAEPTRGQIVRPFGEDDRKRLDHLKLASKREFEVTARHIGELRLQMQLVDIEHLFGGERIVFYFLADKRVDFRELVKVLAREFQTRIELRQIGVRDEAKLLADFGDCGKPVCCNTHMTVMPPVSMRMAKLQKSTLDPTKISGRCGRLKCCLRFEQDVYEEFQATMPPINSRVLTGKGQGRVLAHEILAKRLLVEFEDGRRLPVALDEVLTRIGQ